MPLSFTYFLLYSAFWIWDQDSSTILLFAGRLQVRTCQQGHKRESERLEKEEETCSLLSISWGLPSAFSFPHTYKLRFPTETPESTGHFLLQDLVPELTGLPLSNSEPLAPVRKHHVLRGLGCNSMGPTSRFALLRTDSHSNTCWLFDTLNVLFFTLSVINNTISREQIFY